METPFNPAEFETLDDVSGQRVDEIEHFFVAYNEVEGKQFKPIARRGPVQAKKILERASRDSGG